MDFKVAGTVSGVTALQMDTKLKGLSCEVLGEALKRAQDARLLILDKMRQAIAVSRAELSQYAPRTIKVKINREKIGALIGPGGRTIRSIQSETKARVDVEEDGTVLVSSTSEEAAQKALKTIEELTREVQVGDIYTGKVVRIMDFGAFVEILPGKEGLVHISELADYRVASVGEVVKVGDEIMVKLIEIDRMGRLNLSRKAVFEDSSESAESSAKRQADTHPGYRRSGGGAGIPTRSYHHPRGEQTSPKSYPSRMPHKNLPHRR
jgi:polyribonucleotide nucleotidyltransferase